MPDITKIINALARGDRAQSAELFAQVYAELRRLANRHMAHERSDHTLEPTALVHEAYQRLIHDDAVQWDGRGHFFAAAAEAMRRILIDHARRKKAARHGGKRLKVPLDDHLGATARDDADTLLSLSEALEKFAVVDPAKAELVKLRYFAGMSLEDAAAALGISRATAQRHWTYARAWLLHALQEIGPLPIKVDADRPDDNP